MPCPGRGAARLRCSAEPGPRRGNAARWTPDQQRTTSCCAASGKRFKRLRAGMPKTVVAEVGARRRVVGPVGLHAPGDRIVAAGDDRDRCCIVILVVIVAGRVVARSAIITVALGSDRGAADNRAGRKTGAKAAAAVMSIAVTPAAAAVAKARLRRAAAAYHRASGAAAVKPRDRGRVDAGIEACCRRAAATVETRNRCAAATVETRNGCATAATDASAALDFLILGETCAWRGHRQQQGYCGRGTQNSKI